MNRNKHLNQVNKNCFDLIQGCNRVSKFHLVSIRYQIDTDKLKKRYLLDTKCIEIRYQKKKTRKFYINPCSSQC